MAIYIVIRYASYMSGRNEASGCRTGSPQQDIPSARRLPRPDPASVTRALRIMTTTAVSPLDAAELARSVQALELQPGTVLYQTGKVPSGVWMIRSGCIEVADRSSVRRRVAALLREGDIAGDLYVLTNSESPLTARSLEKAIVWFLPADTYRRVLMSCPSLTVAWLCSLAARLCDSRTRILEVLGGTLEQRVARLLLEESRDGTLFLPQQTLAQMLGVQRTSLNKTLKRMERGGVVTIGYGKLHLRDRSRLRMLAEGSAVVRRSPVEPQDVDGAKPAGLSDEARTAIAPAAGDSVHDDSSTVGSTDMGYLALETNRR